MISVRVEKNVERSGRRGREPEEVDGSSLACSPLIFQFMGISLLKARSQTYFRNSPLRIRDLWRFAQPKKGQEDSGFIQVFRQ